MLTDNPVPIHYNIYRSGPSRTLLTKSIGNALKYSDDDVKITVVLSEHDNHLSIAIQDTGWGIPQKAQKKLGKQFYRVQIEGKKFIDHGLGLAV